MNHHFTPRYAVVTGAGSGLGRAFCEVMANEGWHLAVTDLNGDSADQTRSRVESSGGSAEAHQLDVTDESAWCRLRDRLRESWPQLDLLINNAGICASGEVERMAPDTFRRVLEVNLHGVFLGCHTMVPWLKESGGRIANVASLFGVLAPPTMAAYNVSKSGIITFSETLFGELEESGVGVTVAIPGFFASQLVEHGDFDDPTHQRIAEQFVRKADVTAEQVARQTLQAVERGRLYVVIGRKARWLARLKRLAPSKLARIAAERFRKKMVKYRVTD